jgi:hypothetical protein
LLGIEEIVESFHRIAPARGNRWNVHALVPNRFHLTRAEDGLFALFLEGEKSSFGSLPAIAAVQLSDDVIGLPDGRRFSALRLVGSDQPNGNRILAHIAYEISWRLQSQPQPRNDELIRAIGWLLILLGPDVSGLSAELQKGLIGECIFLRMLLLRGHERGINNMVALAAWTGHENAKRDFYSLGIAVEVKTTANVTRLHQINSLDQLAPQTPDEEVYLFSVGIRQDPTAPRKVTHYVSDVEALLVDSLGNPDINALAYFRNQLRTYSFDWSHKELYERMDGFLAPHLPPALFRERDLRRLNLNDFVGGKVPETVRSIAYLLEVMATPLPQEDTTRVLDRLLKA